MKLLFENWQKFLNEEEINEVTEEELTHIDDVLMDLKPQDLSFNNIFGDKMRLIQPMMSEDENLKEFKRTLKRNGYEPDFKTGLATYYIISLPGTPGVTKPSSMPLTPDQKEHLLDDEGELDRKNYSRASDEEFEKIKKSFKKKQIKIGKLLQKGSRLFDNAKKAQNEVDKIKPENFGLQPSDVDAVGDEEKAEKFREAYKEAAQKADRYRNQFNDAFIDVNLKSHHLHPDSPNGFQNLSSWWNKKSTFYRENPEAAETGLTVGDKSIIYSRHPIDVLRMSDFDNIESCHSPESRGGGATYYKCAVAEAHAHGFIAYVVKNEDLKATKSTYDYEDLSDQELLDAYQEADEEFFLDSERGEGAVNPIARLRIKKYTAPTLGLSLAVPEHRVYGQGINKELFSDEVLQWAKDNQPEAIQKVVDSKNDEDPDKVAIDDTDYMLMGKWERHGGSYQDTGDVALFVSMFQDHIEGGRGNVHVDTTTEDNITVGVIDQWQEQVDEIRDRYNRRYQSARITRAAVEDDGAGEAYVDIDATLRIVLDESDFVISAFQDKVRNAIDHIPSELEDMGITELGDYIRYTTLNPRSQDWADLIRQVDEEDKGKIVIEIPIDIEQVNPEGGGYGYSPDNFEDIASGIDELDDKTDMIESLIRTYLKREGILEGGALIVLAQALVHESWYEWNHEPDDDWAPESIEVETAAYVNFEDLVKKLPITFERRAPDSAEVFINFSGDPLALASQTHDGEGNFKWWEVRSPEFEADKLGGFKDLDEVKMYTQDQVAKLILRPKGTKIPKGLHSSRDYLIAVKQLMRDAAEGKQDEFAYPHSSMMANGPDSDDEYKMMFGMHLDQDSPDEVINNAHKIMAETDDEDQLKEIFRKAFAIVGKIPGENLAEAKNYFRKFDFF